MAAIDRFKENSRILLQQGATVEIATYEPTMDSTESVLEVPPAAELAIRGLCRAHAIILFRGLNTHMNLFTEPLEVDIALDPLEALTDDELNELDREELYVAVAGDAHYEVALEEAGPAVFDLHVRPGEEFKDDPAESVKKSLEAGYIGVLSEVDLSGKLAAAEPRPSEPAAAEAPVIPSANEKLSVMTRKSNPRKFHGFRSAERRQELEDLQEVQFLCDIFGLEEMDQVSSAELVDLWRNRKRSHVAVIDLFLHSVSRIQQVNGTKSYFDTYTPKLMMQYAAKNKPFELRRRQEDQSVKMLNANLNINEEEADAIFFEAQGELAKAGLRFLAWLTDQPVMEEFNEKVRAEFREDPDKRLSVKELYIMATEHLRKEATVLFETFTLECEGAATTQDHDDGVLIYDRSIPEEQGAYIRKLNFLRTLIALSKYIFTDEKMNKYLAE